MNYYTWSRVRLIREIKMLREGMHKLSKETMPIYIKYEEQKHRLKMIEQHREVFHG